eukprot:CAMPEP_0206139884 /NCGR_PEP_ID=MMETSP1473-20131121/7638_1 /ASSEMBLY_ACC=CAM_ASM_001109 /TAXON_ID=1461547 /ORGANISM="Stichococcus sp, Strain RCC1054" /LENGTH=69 /DNA_ID=CAMNT_0053533813 /DNA_START=118 /DNA_END=324 /DNA_ORIENTATION=-
MWLLRRSSLHSLARFRGIALAEDVCARASACLLGTKSMGLSRVPQHSVQQAQHQGIGFGSVIQQRQQQD